MRKRNCDHLFDTIFWYLIYALPLIVFVVLICQNPSGLTFANSFDVAGLNLVQDGLIFDALNSLFGPTGILPLFADTGILLYFSWFVGTMIAHLAVDFLLFIPRLAHKFMDKFTQNQE